MNPMTGQPEFIEDTPVINETTGQQANTAGQTATAVTTAQPVLSAPAPEPFKVEKDNVGFDIGKIDNTMDTASVMDFRDEAEQTAQGRFAESLRQQQALQAQILELAQPSPELEQALADLNTVREDRTRLLDFSEDRTVDIGTIRGEQAQTERAFQRREQTAINKANLLLNRQAQQISATEKALQFNQQNLDTVLKLSELTSPDIIGQEIDPVTGEVIAFMQNADGTVTSQIIGKISVPDPAKETVGIVTNKATGQQSLVSLKDGVMVVEPIEGTAGVAGVAPLTEQDKLRNELLRAQIAKTYADATQGERDAAVEAASATRKANDVFTVANTLLNSPEYIDALSGVSGATTILTQTGRDADAVFDRLTGLLTVDNLNLMSGVLTDKDIEILRDAATSLRKGMSREDLVAELTRLRDEADYKISGNVPLGDQAAAYGFSIDEQDEIDFLIMGGVSTDTMGDYSSYYGK